MIQNIFISMSYMILWEIFFFSFEKNMFVFTDVYVFHRHCYNKTDIAREIVDCKAATKIWNSSRSRYKNVQTCLSLNVEISIKVTLIVLDGAINVQW